MLDKKQIEKFKKDGFVHVPKLFNDAEKNGSIEAESTQSVTSPEAPPPSKPLPAVTPVISPLPPLPPAAFIPELSF